MLTESALSLGLRGPLVSFSVDPPTYLHSLLSSPSSPVSASSEVCALYPPVKEKVHCSAPNSVKNLVMHRIR